MKTKMPEPPKRNFEVYTLSETFRMQAINLVDAYNRTEMHPDKDPVIGIIEIDLFHKGAIQRPDLI